MGPGDWLSLGGVFDELAGAPLMTIPCLALMEGFTREQAHQSSGSGWKSSSSGLGFFREPHSVRESCSVGRMRHADILSPAQVYRIDRERPSSSHMFRFLSVPQTPRTAVPLRGASCAASGLAELRLQRGLFLVCPVPSFLKLRPHINTRASWKIDHDKSPSSPSRSSRSVDWRDGGRGGGGGQGSGRPTALMHG